MLDRSNAATKSREHGAPVRGTGREMYARTEFDPKNAEVRESMVVYSRLQDAARAAGARLLVVFLPLSYAIHPEDESRWRHLGVVDVTQEAAFNNAFVSYLNKNRIPTLDITDKLRKSAESGKRLYFWLDIHWTPIGNATAARAVADYLTR